MRAELLRTLEQRRAEIRARWETLLRLEKPPTPLANPDILVHLFDHTLNEVLSILPLPPVGSIPSRPVCRCDCNPLRHYYATLEQALLETLIWVQAEEPGVGTAERVASVGELCQRMRQVAWREILLLDGLCQCASCQAGGPEIAAE
ncbi:MAG: hypothetical protein ACOZE5_16320 [Verrucomicrobiota bacterium]